MHDGFQIGTIAVILFGIMLNRYDTGSLRKEIRQDMSDLRNELRKDMSDLRSELRKEMSDLRAEVHRSTTLVKKLLFGPTPNASRS